MNENAVHTSFRMCVAPGIPKALESRSEPPTTSTMKAVFDSAHRFVETAGRLDVVDVRCGPQLAEFK